MIKEFKKPSPKYQLPIDCPRNGQFVVIWEYDNEVWSNTYKWKGDTICVYKQQDDGFEPVNSDLTLAWMNANTTFIKFFTATDNLPY